LPSGAGKVVFFGNQQSRYINSANTAFALENAAESDGQLETPIGWICRISGLFATSLIFLIRRRTGQIRLGSESKDEPKPLNGKAD
jgi:hypothetical protein